MEAPTSPMIEYALLYGSKDEPLVLVRQDKHWGWRGMFRIYWPDGQVSDMVNLSRAKDAARDLVRRRHPKLGWKLMHWKASGSIQEPSPMRDSNGGLLE